MKSRFPIVLLALAATAACSPAPDTPAKVQVSDAWCRAAPAGALTGGCYATLVASTDDRLTGVDTPAADHGELHTMDMEGGVMRMRKLPRGIELPAGEKVRLAPGGLHIMVIGPRTPLTAGGAVPLILTFAKARPVSVNAPVRAVTPGPHASMEHR